MRNTAHIENEAAYENAIHERIRANRRKTAIKRFEALPDHAEIAAFLERRVSSDTAQRYAAGTLFDLNQARELTFIDSCWFYMVEGGSPSDKQIEAVRRMLVKNAERRAERAQADAGSQHVGEIGKRQAFTLPVRSVVNFDGFYGPTWIFVFADEAGNVIVYKGSKRLGFYQGTDWIAVERGDVVTFKATIKAHGERDGVKQTLLARPVVMAITKPEAGA